MPSELCISTRGGVLPRTQEAVRVVIEPLSQHAPLPRAPVVALLLVTQSFLHNPIGQTRRRTEAKVTSPSNLLAQKIAES